MNIKIVRLLNGEDVIADVTDNGPYITVKDPVRIVIMPSAGSKTPNVGFAPWAPFSTETEFNLDKSHTIVIMEPIEEFVTQYKMSTSPIVTPPSSKLILPKR